MRCSSLVGKEEEELWRSRGVDALKFAFIHRGECCRTVIEMHLSRSSLRGVILAGADRARSRAIRRKMSWNICRETATSATWNMT